MNSIRSSTLVVFMAILFVANAQWFIIKKDYPSTSMNYPNPGKRNIGEEELKILNVDCSIPYSTLHSYEEKNAWILFCNDDKFQLRMIKDSSSSSSSNSMEDEYNSTPRFIVKDRRTARTTPPYFFEHSDLFNRRRVLKGLRRYANK